MPSQKVIKFDGFSQDEAESIRKQAKRFQEKASTSQTGLFQMVNDLERVARVQLPKELAQQFEGVTDVSQLVPPDAHIGLRSLLAGIIKLIFARKPYGRLSIEGKPNERSERLQKAEWTLQNDLDIQHKGAGYESMAADALYQLLYAGVTCTVTHWVQRFNRKAQRDEQSRIILDEKTKRPIFHQAVVAEYVQTDHIDIRRVWIDPSVTKLQDARIVGYQSKIPFSKLQVMNRDPESYIKFDEQELVRTTFSRDLYEEHFDKTSVMDNELGNENEDFGDKTVEKWEIRGMFRIEKKDGTFDFRDLIVCIANRDKLIGLKENDLPLHGWELFDFPYISPDAGRAFRQGIIEPLLDEFIELFIKRNQSLDEANQGTHGMYLADSAATQTLEDYIEYYRGRVIKVDTQGAGLSDVRQAFAQFPRLPSTQDTFRHALQIKGELKEGMGVSDYMQGTDPDSTETATGVTALITGGMANLELMAMFLKVSMFAPNWQKTLILWNFFKGHEENKVYDLKGNPIDVLPGDLDYFFRVDIDISTSIDYPAMVRRFVETYPTMINDPYWDQYEIRNALKEVLQMPNGDRLLPPSQAMADVIERENAALLRGVQLFVSEFDPHSTHIMGHTEALKMAQGTTRVDGQPLDTTILEQHIVEHQEAQIAQQEQQKGLGNSKEFGGSSGQNLSSENAANRSIPAAGGQRRRVS